MARSRRSCLMSALILKCRTMKQITEASNITAVQFFIELWLWVLIKRALQNEFIELWLWFLIKIALQNEGER